MSKKPTYEKLERKVFEQDRLEKRLRLLSLAVDQSSEGIAVVDLDGNLQYLNNAFAKMHGYSTEELVGKNLSIFHTLDQMPSVEAANLETKQTGFFKGEIWHVRRDGAVFPTMMHNSIIRDEKNMPIGIMGTLRDISDMKQTEEALRESERKTGTERKRTEESLREREKQIRLLLDSTAEAIYGLDMNGNCTFVNPACLKLLGFKATDDLIGKNMHSLIHHTRLDGSSYPVEECRIYQAFRRGEGSHVDDEVLWRAGGTSFPAEYWSYPIFEDDKVIGSVVTFLDITERKQTEDALRESEEKYRLLIDNLPNIVFKGYKDGSVDFTDDKIELLTGYKKDEFNFRRINWFDIVVEEDKEKMRQTFIKALKTNKSYIREYRIKTKAGGVLWIQEGSQILCVEGGGIEYISGAFLDITERKIAEEDLKESEKKYRDIFENVSDFLYFHDLEGNFIETNFAFNKIYGLNKEASTLPNLIDMVPERYKSQVNDYMERIKKNGKDEGLINVITKDGRKLIIEYKNSLVYDSKGISLGVRGSGRDITERIQAKKEKKKLELQLQQAQKMEAMGALAGGIAHDFNNLLMGIQGRTSLMLMDTDSSHPHSEYLKGIEDYVKSAADLTKQLLGFSRGGKYEVKTTDLNEFIKKQNRMFGRTRKEITIRGRYEKNLWTVEVDQGQIEQVLLNIFVNAWHAMPGGGNLYIQTENVAIDENYNKPYQVEPGKYVRISVRDTGSGMDKATQQKIFDPFFTTKETGRGTGLGLSSAYGIIKNHGGFINVYSEKGEGATFNIYLPVSGKEIIKERKHHEEILRGTETVLIIDDEDIIIDIGKGIIEKLGYKALIATSGKEALKVYKKNQGKIDMVILDMIMPYMGGGETYDRLKEINPDIKVLLSSGYSINGQATEILERGCDGFIQKPFNIVEMSKKIREILDKK